MTLLLLFGGTGQAATPFAAHLPYLDVKLPDTILALEIGQITGTLQSNDIAVSTRVTRGSLYHLDFTNDRLDISSATALTGLLNNNSICVEFSLSIAPLAGPNFQGFLFSLEDTNYTEGMSIGYFKYLGVNYFYAELDIAGDAAATTWPVDLDDNVVRHVEVDFDYITKTIYLFVDGVAQAARDEWTIWEAGVVPSVIATKDAALFNTEIGTPFASNYQLDGSLYWMRFSNTARHTSNFTAPDLNACPSSDTYTVSRFAVDEGTGSTVYDSVASSNGTITGAAWASDGVTSQNTRVTRSGNIRGTHYAVNSYPEIVTIKLPSSLVTLSVDAYSRARKGTGLWRT